MLSVMNFFKVLFKLSNHFKKETELTPKDKENKINYVQQCLICSHFEKNNSLEKNVLELQDEWLTNLKNSDFYFSDVLAKLNKSLIIRKTLIDKCKKSCLSLLKCFAFIVENITIKQKECQEKFLNSISNHFVDLENCLESFYSFTSYDASFCSDFLKKQIVKEISNYVDKIGEIYSHAQASNHKIIFVRDISKNVLKINSNLQIITEIIETIKTKFQCFLILNEANNSYDKEYVKLIKIYNNLWKKLLMTKQYCYNEERSRINNEKQLLYVKYDSINLEIHNKIQLISNISLFFNLVSTHCESYMNSHNVTIKSLKDVYESHSTTFHELNEIFILLNEKKNHLKSFHQLFQFAPGKMSSYHEIMKFVDHCFNILNYINKPYEDDRIIINHLQTCLKENNFFDKTLKDQKNLLMKKWLEFEKIPKLLKLFKELSDLLNVQYTFVITKTSLDQMSEEFNKLLYLINTTSQEMEAEKSMANKVLELLEVKNMLSCKIKNNSLLFEISLKEFYNIMNKYFCDKVISVLKVYLEQVILKTFYCYVFIKNVNNVILNNLESLLQTLISKLEIFMIYVSQNNIRNIIHQITTMEISLHTIKDECFSLENKIICQTVTNNSQLETLSINDMEKLAKLDADFKMNEQDLNLYKVIISDVEYHYSSCFDLLELCKVHLIFHQDHENDVNELYEETVAIIKNAKALMIDVEHVAECHQTELLRDHILDFKQYVHKISSLMQQNKDDLEIINSKIRQIINIKHLILSYNELVSSLATHLKKCEDEMIYSKKELNKTKETMTSQSYFNMKHEEVIKELKEKFETNLKLIENSKQENLNGQSNSIEVLCYQNGAHNINDSDQTTSGLLENNYIFTPNSNTVNSLEVQVTFNEEYAVCPICFDCLMPHDAIILSHCGHMICKHCLECHVKLYDSEELHCPCVVGMTRCTGVINDMELKVSVSEEIYNSHIKRVIKLHEAKSINSFHCQTPGCDYWVIVEDSIIDSMICPLCKVINCLNCRAIHKNMTCKEFQNKKMDDTNLNLTELEIKKNLEKGIIMKCPNCEAIIEKIDGCDGLYCPQCNLQLCWATKGPRWGAKGQGDISGGCRCGVDGILCHPLCNFCH